MPNQTDADIQAERRKYATLRWWRSVLAGRETLGETFWTGNYLSALVVVPLIVMLLVIPPLIPLGAALLGLYGLFLLALTTAVARASPKGGGWTWWKLPAVLLTLLNAATALGLTAQVWSA